MKTLAQFIAALKRIGAPVSNRDLVEKLYCYHVDAHSPPHQVDGTHWPIESTDARGNDLTHHCWINAPSPESAMQQYNARHKRLPRGRIFSVGIPF